MTPELAGWLHAAWAAARADLGWMTWNLALAAVPLALSVALFRARTRRSPLWWAGVVAFILFLPNGPYVLTDLIHLVDRVRVTESRSVIVLAVLPLYAAFLLAGVGAYAVSVLRLGRFLRRHGRPVLPFEIAIHALCALGVYLGRYTGVNSWDVVSRPETVAHALRSTLASDQRLFVVAVTFLVITAVYALLKTLTRAFPASGLSIR